ncbi:glycosyltransferase family 2 protein [Fusobacterium mortiferum]|uniref:glycosyltransferase family 2 protein n=1 Tax=Fusobacterium mortiferum TaxID=850 RepID=UPI001F366726|nr:glycosyltransferase family 2 protein [Fusobacterium mortiferum]MCF2627780.1 glycosyltransferase family 2 protein [Fusobacterium mortiferum]
MNNGLVSIIMPSYNTANYIGESINSVINQSYKNWELIIVDDCSTDNTDEVIKDFLKDSRIKYLKNKENSGAAISRNKALRIARGEWIAFLDSDDLWMPNKLEKQLNFMKKNDYSFTFTDYNIRLNGKWLPYVYTAPDIITKQKMYNYCYFSTITVMWKREKIGLIQIGNLKKNNDYAMWLHAIEKSNAYRLPECLSSYIKHDNSISSGNKLKLIKYHYILFRKGLKKGKILSCIFTIRNLFFGIIKKVKYKKYVKDYFQKGEKENDKKIII